MSQTGTDGCGSRAYAIPDRGWNASTVPCQRSRLRYRCACVVPPPAPTSSRRVTLAAGALAAAALVFSLLPGDNGSESHPLGSGPPPWTGAALPLAGGGDFSPLPPPSLQIESRGGELQPELSYLAPATQQTYCDGPSWSPSPPSTPPLRVLRSYGARRPHIRKVE